MFDEEPCCFLPWNKIHQNIYLNERFMLLLVQRHCLPTTSQCNRNVPLAIWTDWKQCYQHTRFPWDISETRDKWKRTPRRQHRREATSSQICLSDKICIRVQRQWQALWSYSQMGPTSSKLSNEQAPVVPNVAHNCNQFIIIYKCWYRQHSIIRLW